MSYQEFKFLDQEKISGILTSLSETAFLAITVVMVVSAADSLLLMYWINWQDVGSELQRLVELRLLLLELSEQITLKLLKVSTLPDASINQVLHCVWRPACCICLDIMH